MMSSLPDDLREVPFHTMLCPDDCPLCAGANEIERLRNFVEVVEGALGCTDGDDIRTHIEPELAALKQERNDE